MTGKKIRSQLFLFGRSEWQDRIRHRGTSSGRWGVCGFVLAILLGVNGCQPAGSTTAESESNVAVAEKTTARVDVAIDFQGRSDNLQTKVELNEEKTALMALLRACDGKVVYSGQGETAFVKSILGVENEGAGGDNWTYRVNGKLGDRSSGSFLLADEDQVQWTLGKYTPPDAEK